MRSPAVVFSLFAASALSPSLVYGSPVPASVTHLTGADHHRSSSAMSARGLGFLNEVFPRADHTVSHEDRPAPTSKPKVASIAGLDVGPTRRQFWKRGSSMNLLDAPTKLKSKRLDDNQTTGGNAHTGTSGAVDGGSVDSGDNGGMPTLMNVNSNNAGTGGMSETGCAGAGKGATGGNASSGNSGTAYGGDVRGSGGMMNIDSNNAGTAGETTSGCARGGNSADADSANGGTVENNESAGN